MIQSDPKFSSSVQSAAKNQVLGLSPKIRLSASVDPATMEKSAEDFESMTISQLLQPMFDTVKTADNAFGGGAGEDAWRPMLIQAFAKEIAAHGGLGLAKPVYEAMLRMQGIRPK